MLSVLLVRSKPKKDIKIFVDVGHTAGEPGATSARGVPEYDFNMKLAQRIVEELSGAGYRSTQLNVIETIGRSGLLQRPARANNMNADLFISVHHELPYVMAVPRRAAFFSRSIQRIFALRIWKKR
jgi:N-acetylmuramoyl-L-alanine amidase